VEVHCDEGIAIHIGPEPCVHVRENMGEASVGERIGQPYGTSARSALVRRRHAVVSSSALVMPSSAFMMVALAAKL